MTTPAPPPPQPLLAGEDEDTREDEPHIWRGTD